LNDDEEEPLLLKMSQPGSVFVEALKKFKHRTLVGATHYDLLVPHASAMITSHSPHIPPDQ
jgi:hypothetical protein